MAAASTDAGGSAWRTFQELTKIRISSMSTLSTAAGYVAVRRGADGPLLTTLVGTLLVAMGAAALNEVQEWRRDALMPRTCHRPIPRGVVSPLVATEIALGLAACGLLLLGLGMLAFTAGFAGWLLLSPAGVAAISAMVLVNLPGERMEQLLRAVRRVERPAVVILMTVIGFHLSGRLSWVVATLAAAMILVRLAAKRVGGNLTATHLAGDHGLATRRHWADGLAPQGILGLVVTLTFFHIWRDGIARDVLAAVALSGVVNELIAPWLLLRMFRGLSTGAIAATRSEDGP